MGPLGLPIFSLFPITCCPPCWTYEDSSYPYKLTGDWFYCNLLVTIEVFLHEPLSTHNFHASFWMVLTDGSFTFSVMSCKSCGNELICGNGAPPKVTRDVTMLKYDLCAEYACHMLLKCKTQIYLLFPCYWLCHISVVDY